MSGARRAAEAGYGPGCFAVGFHRIAVMLFLLLSPASIARAASDLPVTVKADQLEYFETARKVIARGNVEAVYQDTKLTCHEATIYMETKDAYLRGRVRLVQLDGLLRGDEIIYNFGTRKGTVLEAEGASGFWHSRGDRAQKYAADAFAHRGGYLTSCDFEDPHTRLQGKEIQVYMDDKVVMRHVVMYVGKVPLFYLPSYTYLLDDKRPRVTLIPGKDKEWGLFLLTSWRVYIHENLQGRFHVDYRERLDLATGLDLKYRLPVGGEGLFREYYTNERSLQREHAWSKFFKPEDDRPTVEHERFRVQLRHIWQIDRTTRATLEYNRAKDPNVIKDYFLREYESNQASPSSYFQIIQGRPWYGFTFLVNKRVNRFETVTEQLPFIDFNIRPFRLPWLPRLDQFLGGNKGKLLPKEFQGGADTAGWYYRSSYTYEHSVVGDRRQGQRDSLLTFKTEQEMFHPMRLLGWLNFRPFFRFRQASFSRGATQNSPLFRQAAGTGFDLSTKFFRVFPIEGKFFGIELKQLRHVITPTLAYEYQAKPTLSANRFLRSDNLAKRNVLTPGMEHKLQTKRVVGNEMKTVDLARFLVTMPYDVEGANGRGGRWNNLSLDLETFPYPWMRFEADGTIDPFIGKFLTINADLVVYPKINDFNGPKIGEWYDNEAEESKELPWAAGVGWRYKRNTSAQMTFETEFNLGKKWRAGFYQIFDVKRFANEVSVNGTRTVKKIYDIPEYEYRLRRDLHEWTAELVYNVQRSKGETVLLIFRLKGAPELPVEFERSYHRPKAGRNFRKTPPSK